MNLFSQYLLALLLLSSFLMICQDGRANEASARKPNVVYIMADDLGWGDISAHAGGADYFPLNQKQG